MYWVTVRPALRVGSVPSMAVSIAWLVTSYVLAGLSTALWQCIAASFLMGLGGSATFAPLMAEASHWFERYRGLAVTIVAMVGGLVLWLRTARHGREKGS